MSNVSKIMTLNNKKSLSTPARIATAVALAALLAGCGHYGGRPMEMVSDMNSGPVEKRHPITVSEAPVSLALNASRGASGLNHEQRALVEDFIGNFRTKGKGQLKIEAPSGGANEQAAYQLATEVRDIAEAFGIRWR